MSICVKKKKIQDNIWFGMLHYKLNTHWEMFMITEYVIQLKGAAKLGKVHTPTLGMLNQHIN